MLKLIKTTVLDASAASVTIDNIPQEFKTLKLLVSARIDAAGDAVVVVKPNGSTANLTFRNIYGDGAAAASLNGTDGSLLLSNMSSFTTNTFSNCVAEFPNYAGSTNKAVMSNVVNETNQNTSYLALYASLWSNTSAITSLVCVPRSTANFVAGTTFYLYGIG